MHSVNNVNDVISFHLACAAGQRKQDDDIDDEVSPIDETLRTKFGASAHVDWNGVEKVL